MTEAALAPRRAEPAADALRRMRRLLDLSVVLNTVADIDRGLAAVLGTVTAALDCEHAALLLHDGTAAARR